MDLFPYFDLNTFLWGLGKYIFFLPVFAVSQTPVDPSVPPPEEPLPEDPPDGTGSSGTTGGGYPTPYNNGDATVVSIDQSAHTVVYRLYGGYSGNTGGYAVTRKFRSYRDGGTAFYNPGWGTGTQNAQTFTSLNSGADPVYVCDDNTYTWRAALNTSEGGTALAALKYFKTAAVTATANAPTLPTVAGATLDSTSAYIETTCSPNTLHSTATLQFQYKRTVDSTWIDFSTSASTGGYSPVTFGRTLTGLTPSTSYDVRLKVTRTTVNETLLYSSTTTFSTPANTPTITTDAASSVGQTTANLNCTLTIGNQSSVNLDWVVGEQSDLSDGVAYNYGSNPVSASGSYQLAKTGLTASTTYYAKARVFWNSNTEYSEGSIVSFTTGAVVNELTRAAEEAHMQVFEFNERKYGVAADGSAQSKFYFAVAAPAADNSNYFFNDTSPFTNAGTNGDVRISKDGGAWGKVTNLPVRVGTSPVFALELTATEMQASTIVIWLTDESGSTTPAFRDTLIVIRTKQEISQLVVDASTLSNVNAVTFTGQGTGHGLACVGGATGQDINGVLGEHVIRGPLECQTNATATQVILDSSASSTADFYNGCIVSIVSGTNAGQSRVITDYSGSTTKIATVHKAFNGAPTAGDYFIVEKGPDVWEIPNTGELTAVPTYSSTMGRLLTFLFQRWAYKRTMTADKFIMYKEGPGAALGSGNGSTVTDDGATQTHGQYT